MQLVDSLALHAMRYSLVLIKEARIDSHVLLYSFAHFNAEAKLLEQVAQSVPVDQLDRRSTVAGCLCLGLAGERAGRDQQPFLAPASHRAAEVPYDTGVTVPLYGLHWK